MVSYVVCPNLNIVSPMELILSIFFMPARPRLEICWNFACGDFRYCCHILGKGGRVSHKMELTVFW